MAKEEKKAEPAGQWPEDVDTDYHPYGDGTYPEPGEGGGLGDEGPHERMGNGQRED